MTSLSSDQLETSSGAVLGRTLAQSKPHWPAPVRARSGSPNVIVILMDDMGFSDLGCFGGDIDTPNIDSLATGGLRFTGYTTVPMCTPARAALLTGRNPHSVGCGWLSQSNPGYPGYGGEISLAAPTMAELLRAAGYSTLAAGKWHNTYDRNNVPGGDTRSWPIQRGFDQFYGFMGAETSYFQPDNMMEGNHLANVACYPDGYFAPDDYTQRALEWITQHATSSPDRPFFL
ncbi:MAG: sulfatase-like hydrolase/transferase, partial [Betaproteobacteria bacterium]